MFSRNKDRDRKAVFRIPSRIEHLRKTSSRILDALVRYNVPETTLFNIRLCVEEAVRNAIVHGNHCDKHLSVTIAHWAEGRKFFIEVADEGRGFDYRRLPDPTDSEHILRNSGRGVYLIRKLMDKVDFNEAGNRIRMMKHL
ncbi:MAG: ATP-binding protein [Candidatus Omnitrophica bacterium]|nr:ATP-binding protein [Candidatus Omnitrophota bacterium]